MSDQITERVDSRVRVRLARQDDQDELAAIGEITVQAYTVDGHSSPGQPYAEELADTARRARDAQLLVAVDEHDQPLGTVTLVPPGTPFAEIATQGELEFRMLAVRPDARRRGVAAMLLRAVVDHARSGGYRRVVLSSLAEMTAAHRLYERFGFRREPGRDWRPDGPGTRYDGRLSLFAFTLDL